MDGSRRSTHSNAFFAGFGTFVVSFSIYPYGTNERRRTGGGTAREIGHYKLGIFLKWSRSRQYRGYAVALLAGWQPVHGLRKLI